MIKFNISWIIISVLFLFSLLLKYFFNFKPKFILPKSCFVVRRRMWYRWTFSIIVFCLLLLPLDIQILESKNLVEEKNMPIQVLFDVSLSMAADDIQPSRFVAAKSAFNQLVMSLEWYQTSLIAFSKIPFVWIPFSKDTFGILHKWRATSLVDFPPVKEFVGTAIGDALLLWMSNLEKFTTKEMYPGVIVLFTDGDSHEWSDPYDILPLLQKKWIPVYVFGIGEQNFVIGVDREWAAVQARVNIQLLKNIAEKTWWKFFRILNSDSFSSFVKEIVSQVKISEKEYVQEKYFAINHIILFVLAFALVLFGLFHKFRYRKKLF